MYLRNYILILVFIFSLSSCKDEKAITKTIEISENISTDLDLDHFNIWVKNPQKFRFHRKSQF